MMQVASGGRICNELSEERWGPIVALGMNWHNLYRGQFVSVKIINAHTRNPTSGNNSSMTVAQGYSLKLLMIATDWKSWKFPSTGIL